MFKSFFKDSIISIDIGFRNIKLIEVELSKKGDFLLNSFDMAPTPRGCIKNGHIKEVAIISEVIRDILYQNKIKSKDAKIVMSGTHITSRILIVEAESDYNVTEIVKKALIENMPTINFNTHKVDYKILGVENTGDKVKIKLFITSVLKTIVESYVEILDNLGLNALAADIPSNSTAKLFQDKINLLPNCINIGIPASNLGETFSVIDFGSETTIINILHNRILEFNKVILLGSSNIDESISAATMQKLSESEIIKKTYGLNIPTTFSSEQNESIHNAIKGTVNGIVNQIYRSFNYYTDRCGGTNVDKIFLIGGGAQLAGLKEYLAKTLNTPVFLIDYSHLYGINLSKNLDSSKINYLINAIGVSF